MNSIDKFSNLLFEEAKRFLEKAKNEKDDVGQVAFCHASLLLGFSSLEAHMNALSEELALRDNLDILTKSISLERDFRLDKGRFELTTALKMYRLEDKLEFLFANFSMSVQQPPAVWWGDLKNGMQLRNRLVHPKQSLPLTTEQTGRCLDAIIECLNALYMAVFKKPHPSYKRKLNSNLVF